MSNFMWQLFDVYFKLICIKKILVKYSKIPTTNKQTHLNNIIRALLLNSMVQRNKRIDFVLWILKKKKTNVIGKKLSSGY